MLRQILDSPWFYFGGAGLLLVVAVLSQFDVRIPSRPGGTAEDIARLKERDDLNVVFILVDTLRADRLGIYGYERPTSPVIDDIGGHGIVFKNTIGQSSWTKSSMASLWTSTFPSKNGITRYNTTLPPEVEFPAEVFKRAGFRTAGIWRNGWVAPNFGFNQGFDSYVKPMGSPERRKIQRSGPSARTLKGTDLDVLDSAVEFTRNFGHERFFLYMHLMDIHQYVYDDQAPDFGTSYSDVYDQSINWTDRIIGMFLREIDDLGLLTNTIVVIASDHGEAFEEHGYEGHARNLYREVAAVPFIIMLPFVLETGIEVEELVGNVDIWPTIFDLVGLPPIEGVDGVSQLPRVLEAAGLDPGVPIEGLTRPIFSELDRRWGNAKEDPNPLVSVTDERVRAFIAVNDPDSDELYDIATDRMEQEDLADERVDDVAAYRTIVERYREDNEPPWGVTPGTVELEEMQLNQLRALGYKVGD
jgi:arylsulfatase A-like enzyme